MSIELKIEPIEVAVLKDFFKQKGLSVRNTEGEPFYGIGISGREYTGVGFMTEFCPSDELTIGPLDYNDRWLDTHATLNGILKVGFLVYIDSGRITAIEGFAYGDESWPDTMYNFTIEHIEVAHIPPRTDD